MNKTLFTLVLLRTACCYVAPAKPWRAAPRSAPTGRAAVRMGSNPLAKAFKTVPDWRKGIHGATVALTRVCAGVLMVHHGSEGGFLPANVDTPEFKGFVDFVVAPHLSFLPGGPESFTAWAAAHDYAEV